MKKRRLMGIKHSRVRQRRAWTNKTKKISGILGKGRVRHFEGRKKKVKVRGVWAGQCLFLSLGACERDYERGWGLRILEKGVGMDGWVGLSIFRDDFIE